MSEQPEAARLAKLIEGNWSRDLGFEASAELRRLHEVNQELLEALKHITHYAECSVAAFSSERPYLDMTLFPRLCDAARAAIARAEGETK